MINSKVDHCKTLEEFYFEIRKQQTDAHGEHYCNQHDAISKYMKECTSYKELGTHQGGTAAAACLTNPKSVNLIDISMEKYNQSKHLFEKYCTENNIDLVVLEMESTNPKGVSECDLLLIDSRHEPNHLKKELDCHAKKVNKYMIFHDTSIINGRQNESLYHVLEDFTGKNTVWKIIERDQRSVGYTVLLKEQNKMEGIKL